MATIKTVRVPSTAPAPKKDASTAPKAKVVKPSINVGVTTGMRVMAYQDKLFADNLKAKLTDEQLLEAMRKEFPNAKGKIFTAPLETRLAVLRSVRRVFNAGQHGKQQIEVKTPVPAYDSHGNPLAEVKRTRTPKAAPAPAAPPKVEPEATKPVATKRVRRVAA